MSHSLRRKQSWRTWEEDLEICPSSSTAQVVAVTRHGLAESNALSVDDVWAALKFTFPKEGRQYNYATANCLRHSDIVITIEDHGNAGFSSLGSRSHMQLGTICV